MEGILDKTLDSTYRIDQLLGRGGMGAVYRAHDTTLNRDVAIKVMHPHLSDDPDFRARFLQEARAIASLQHPGIVQVYAAGSDLGLLYIVMDFIPGQTLQTWLRRLATERQIVVLSESLAIIRQVALGLHYAHVKGVVHRDIKPSNIMMRPTDPALRGTDELAYRPVLTDFGLAKLAAGGIHTLTGTSLGTPAYMSPEQCRGMELDGRTDIYSLGIVLFQMVTGRVPFEVQSLTEAIRCHTEEPPPPPRSINPTLPLEVENLVLRTLAKRAQDRFSTAQQMADALAHVIPHLSPDLTSAALSAAVPPQSPDGLGAGEMPTAYISLMTMIGEQSDSRYTAITGQYEAVPAAGMGANLVVMSPDGQRRPIPLGEKRVLTVGRAADNDIQLDDQKVSRRHVRIEFDGRNLTVTDLNSTNGSFLANSRLLPGVSQPWSAGTVLHVGEHQIRFEVQASPAPSLVDAAPPRSHEGPPPAIRLAEATLEPQTLTVEAGASAECRLTAANLGAQVDHFQVSVAGIPGAWVPGAPPVILLNPNEEETVRLTIQPPRSPEGRAGTYPLTVALVSQRSTSQVAEARGTLIVNPFHELSLTLHPQRQSATNQGTFTVQVCNQGNCEVSVDWDAVDPEEGCIYAFDPPHVVLAPGEEHAIGLQVSPRAPLSRGFAKPYPFVVTAHLAQAPELSLQVQGQWTHLPPDFELALSPQRQAGIGEGEFSVQVSNHGASGLELELSAADAENRCLYALEPTKMTVPAGDQRQAKLRVRSTTPLSEGPSRTFSFAVTARPVDTPRLGQEVHGEWEQIPPAFEVTLIPQAQSGTTEGTYQVQVSNEGAADVTVQLEATEAGEACHYVFTPPKLSVPARQQRTASLLVRARATPESRRRNVAFAVTARSVEAPGFWRQVQGEWTQLPPTRRVPQPAPPQVQRGTAYIIDTRPFWGCATLLCGLILTAGVGFGAGTLLDLTWDLRNLALPVAIVFWLGGLVLTIVLSRRIWRRRIRLPARPERLPEE